MSKEEKADKLISDDMWVYGYTVIDKGVIFSKEITDSEFRTYSVIRSMVNQKKAIAWPSYDTISELSGHSKRTAIRNVVNLEKIDLIQKISRTGTSNEFIVKKMQNSSVLKKDDDIQGTSEREPEPDKKADPIPFKKIVDHLNDQAGTNFNHTGQANQKLIRARWNELDKLKMDADVKVEQFTHVIDAKAIEWGSDDFMKKYMRPSTLFGNKFDQYRNEQIGQTGQPSAPGNKQQQKTQSELEKLKNKYQGDDDQ